MKHSSSISAYAINGFSQLTIDLFRLYILFSQYKSCDNTQEDWYFVLLIKKSAGKHEYVKREYACTRSF